MKQTLAFCVMVAGLVAVFYVGTAQAGCKNCPKPGKWLGKTASDEYGAFGSVRFKVKAETKEVEDFEIALYGPAQCASGETFVPPSEVSFHQASVIYVIRPQPEIYMPYDLVSGHGGIWRSEQFTGNFRKRGKRVEGQMGMEAFFDVPPNDRCGYSFSNLEWRGWKKKVR